MPLALSFGPSTLFLMNTVLSDNKSRALLVLTGIVLSDMLILTISLIGNNFLLIANQYAYHFLLLSFSLFLIVAGVVGIVKALRKTNGIYIEESKKPNKLYNLKYPLLIGVFLNTSNPMNFIFWIGVASWLLVFFKPFSSGFFGFLAGLFITTISGDIFKIFLSDLLRKYLKYANTRLIRIMVSIMLIFIGLYFIFFLIK